MKLRTCLVAALLIAAPASMAAAAPGLVRSSATMRAGPGSGFPAVERIPAGTRVTIHGCIEGGAWCDVSLAGERGWVAARALAYLNGQSYVYLPEYVEYVPVAPFVLTTYWSSFYFGRPWYHRHAFWNRYWHRQPPVMAQTPPQPNMGAAGPSPGGGAHPVGAPGGGVAGSPAPVAGRPGVRPVAVAVSPTGGPPQGARAQMRMVGGLSQLGGSHHLGGSAMMNAPRGGGSGMRGGGRSGGGGGFHRH
ncbi:SH3 domain-containing protein [Bradyrhizobium sp. HKCCYLS20291]|uniref:SH3 domain-containing protein n=1 Tax=Bradyrhizobium sp. HKCCYLS20291 TaxID=3420766 RepID=UPI003EC03C23